MTNYEMIEQITALAKLQYGAEYSYSALWGMSQALLTENNLKTILSVLENNKENK